MSSIITRHVPPILRGVGQIMLQNNSYSGILFLAGIFYNSWLLGLAAIAGASIGTYTARILKYEEADIENGLYGFNSALVGIAILFYFGLNSMTVFVLLAGAAGSTVVMNILKKRIPAYTSPFVLVTWVGLGFFLFVWGCRILPGAEEATASIDIVSAVVRGLGQVMFQENTVTGVLFLLGILVNSGLSAGYALYASWLGLAIGWLFSVSGTTLNAGLMSYNGILCAIALAGTRRSDFVWVTLAVFLSVALQIYMVATGIISLTAPFVVSTWAVLIIKNKTKNYPIKYKNVSGQLNERYE
ncbi:MAG: urea transporter [Bacteroidetes bacterium]|nr:urea transporter [Bacteroidota bacterium]